MELMSGNARNMLEPFKSSLFLNQEYKLDGLWSYCYATLETSSNHPNKHCARIKNTEEMVYGVNVSQCFKNVRTIRITIVFKSRIQIRWFVELMQGNFANKFEPLK